MIFRNKNRSCPIRGPPDDNFGVSYRSGPKVLMYSTVALQWPDERKVIMPLAKGRTCVLYLDNCSGHKFTPEFQVAASRIRTSIRCFYPNLTDYVQPCDSFIIQKINVEWSQLWEAYKIKQVMEGNLKESSGSISNPRKSFFLDLALKSVAAVNHQRDSNGIFYSLK